MCPELRNFVPTCLQFSVFRYELRKFIFTNQSQTLCVSYYGVSDETPEKMKSCIGHTCVAFLRCEF